MGKLKLGPEIIIFSALAATLILALNPTLFSPPAGNVGTGFIVTYSDGSEQVFTGANPVSLQVVDPVTGKTINSIYCTVRVTPTWTGAKSSSLVTGTVTVKNNGVTKYTESPTNPTLTSGTQALVWSRTIYNSELNTWAPVYLSGGYTLLVEASITVKITFTGGSTSSKTSTGSGSIKYSYSGG
jgi:hypothetical protein